MKQCKYRLLNCTYVQFELCAQNIVSGDVVDTLYRCVHNVYVAHQAGMPRQQDAHGIFRVRTIEGVMYIYVLGKFNLSILWQAGFFFASKWSTMGSNQWLIFLIASSRHAKMPIEFLELEL